MSKNKSKSSSRGSLIFLGVIIVAIFGSLFAGVKWSDATLTPKLALDLEGGTQIILRPVTENNEAISSEDINQAIAILRQRVDSSGVAEAEITSQGGQNIVVALPGKPDQATLDLVRESAQMQFRSVLYFGQPAPISTAEPTADATTDPSADPSAEASTDPSAEPTAEASAAPTAEATPEPERTYSVDDFLGDHSSGSANASNPSDLGQITQAVMDEFLALDCTAPENLVGARNGSPKQVIVACDQNGAQKYILGPMEIAGTDIKSADAALRVNQNTGATMNEWAVSLEFTKEGTKAFTEVTTRLSQLPDATTWAASATAPTSAPGMFAMVLDGLVISAPGVETALPDGKAEITGSFTRTEAMSLANKLNFGALPLTFEVQSEEQISATLGSEQLEKGLIAGVIGLVLVLAYSMVQYRTLGLLTGASLLIAGILTFGVISLLSWTQGYRLSLPGVAGLIVAIGITADSFIVYFERIRDELRDGRSLNYAVEHGWTRAKRTILASDAVNLLAAVVLYFLAVGGVRGFAFTLGLTTLIDVMVVFLFTHPIMKLLAKTKFFGHGHKLSGLDPRQFGSRAVVYAGRGKVENRLTIAERKAKAEREKETETDAKNGDL